MAVRVKFPIVDKSVVFSGDGIFSPKSRAKAFAEMARASILEIDQANDAAVGRDVKYRTFVDGRQTSSLEIATERSEIVARWDLGTEVVAYIWDLLERAGPVRTGAFRASRRMYADGIEIKEPEESFGAREVLFLSIAPYARKIERGLRGYNPGHVYEAVASMANGRFSNVARVKFTYAEPEGAAPELRRWAMQNAHGVGPAEWKPKKMAQADADARKSRTKMIKNMRQPAIIVYLT